MTGTTEDNDPTQNDSETRRSDTGNTRGKCSRNVLEQTRRDLIVMRAKHGAETAIGYRCSNLVELMQMPEIPTRLVARQMADLQRLLAQ